MMQGPAARSPGLFLSARRVAGWRRAAFGVEHACRSGWINLIEQKSRPIWKRARFRPLNLFQVARIVL